MDLPNAAIADALEELGDLYELDGAIVHRVLAYRNAAKSIREASVSVAALARAGRATELAGIGATLQQKIITLLDTGTTPSTERMRAQFPPGLIAITRLPGLGPKRARLLFTELGVDSPEKLREAALAQRLRDVRGLGAKFEASVLEGLDRMAAEPPERASGRLLLPRAIELGETLAAGLMERGDPGTHVQLAGSARRLADSVKDIDLVAVTTKPTTLAKSLSRLGEIEHVSSAGKPGARGRTHSGVSVDLRIAKPAQLGNLLQHFTGSGPHNAALREAAVRKGMHVSEYGVLVDGEKRPKTFDSEEQLYGLLDLAYIEPELREHRGELAAAGSGQLPQLIELDDIRGDLHCHTTWSDGRASVEEMARAALRRGHEYLAICDHTPAVGAVRGLTPNDVRRQAEEIAAANELLAPFRVLHGIECDILPDGRLDLPDAILAQLDWVQASVHGGQRMPRLEMTKRVEEALRNPSVRCLSHPTGRYINRRPENALDLERVFEVALEERVALEVNGLPARLDLGGEHVRDALRAGVQIVCSTDAHSVRGLENMTFSVATARRGWATPANVLNTRPVGVILDRVEPSAEATSSTARHRPA